MTDAASTATLPLDRSGGLLAILFFSVPDDDSAASFCARDAKPLSKHTQDEICLTVTGTHSAYPANLFAPSQLTLKTGQTTILLGANGTGKSTLLRLLAGLEKLPESIVIKGLEDTCRRAYMTQDVQLLPWFCVAANACIGARLRGERPDRAGLARVLEQLDLTNDAQKYPAQISGGMAQRTSLARTLLEDADLNLLDEPFAALDAITRWDMQNLLKEHFAGRTVVMVTHDPAEAVRLGDAIYIFSRTQRTGPIKILAFESRNSDAGGRVEQLFARLGKR